MSPLPLEPDREAEPESEEERPPPPVLPDYKVTNTHPLDRDALQEYHYPNNMCVGEPAFKQPCLWFWL